MPCSIVTVERQLTAVVRAMVPFGRCPRPSARRGLRSMRCYHRSRQARGRSRSALPARGPVRWSGGRLGDDAVCLMCGREAPPRRCQLGDLHALAGRRRCQASDGSLRPAGLIHGHLGFGTRGRLGRRGKLGSLGRPAYCALLVAGAAPSGSLHPPQHVRERITAAIE